MKTDAAMGHLDALILAVIEARPAHGYAVIEELRARSQGRFNLPEGTVYPALHRLELNGLLSSSWTTSAGRRRRLYALTPAGLSALATERQEWQRFARAVGTVLEPV